jgi:hypothetical protein
LLAAALLAGLMVEQAAVAPMPPMVAVNHATKQCAEFFAGDECMDCSPPEGWEILGTEGESECPSGYALTEVPSVCTAFKVEFCCTAGHSGAPGDCQDVVINRAAGQCAFVEDIDRCPRLPAGWENFGRECPPEYAEWVEAVVCLGELEEPPTPIGAGGNADQSTAPAQAGQESTTAPPIPSPATNNDGVEEVPAGGLVLTGYRCAAHSVAVIGAVGNAGALGAPLPRWGRR